MTNTRQRYHEIEMMWRQLDEFGAVREHDYKNGFTVRLSQQTHVFGTGREVHAFLSGALDMVRLLSYLNEKAGVGDGRDNEDEHLHEPADAEPPQG